MDEPVVIIPAEELEEEIEASQEDATDTEELVRTLTMYDERQKEILKEVAECKAKLEALSNQVTTLSTLPPLEAPTNQQMVTDLMEIRSQLDRLNSLIADLKQSNQKHPVSQAPPQQMESGSPNQENPMVVIVPEVEQPEPAKRRRVIKL